MCPQDERINDAANDLDGSGSGDDDDDDGWGDDAAPSRHSPDRGQQPPSGEGGRRSNFPPDDEDGYSYPGGGSGDGPPRSHWDPRGSPSSPGGRNSDPYDTYEGSGGNRDDDYTFRKHGRNNNNMHYPPPLDYDHGGNMDPPSGVAKEEMSLTKAITVYLIPAIIMYFGSIG